MPDGIQVGPEMPENLRERVCDADDGLTIEELLERSRVIIERTAAQWRLGALFDIEKVWDPSDAIHRNVADIKASLPRFFEIARATGDEALILGFARIREAADHLNACAQRLNANPGDPEEDYRLIADLAQAVDNLEEALTVDQRE